jgi:hypothetical protein
MLQIAGFLERSRTLNGLTGDRIRQKQALRPLYQAAETPKQAVETPKQAVETPKQAVETPKPRAF